jgi:hypothetical protein
MGKETFDEFNGEVNPLNLKRSEMEKLHNKIINGFQEEFSYRDMSDDFIENQIMVFQGKPTSEKDQEDKLINMLKFNSHKFIEIEVGLLKCNLCGYSIPFKPIPKNVEICKKIKL